MPVPMTSQEVHERLAAFRSGATAERFFVCPTRPAELMRGLCYCNRSLPTAMLFYLRAGLLLWVLRLPFNAPKLWILRRFGAKIGSNVNIAVDVWIDPLFLDLLTIEDDVIIGVGARIMLHDITTTQFRVGRVTIRRGAVIGGCAILGPGIEIGEEALVAGAAAVGRDVPAHSTAIGNPARVVHPDRAEAREIA